MILWSWLLNLWSDDPMILRSWLVIPWSDDPMIRWSDDPVILWSWLVIRWSCDPALLTVRKEERRLRKEGGTLANFLFGMISRVCAVLRTIWLASCVASAGGEVVIIRPSIKKQWKNIEKLIDHLLKFIEKCMKNYWKNQPKINQKSTKNQPKIDENRGPEGVWADSRFKGRLGRRLGGP